MEHYKKAEMNKVAYPVPLGSVERIAILYLPEDLTKKEAKKLAAVVKALAVPEN